MKIAVLRMPGVLVRDEIGLRFRQLPVLPRHESDLEASLNHLDR